MDGPLGSYFDSYTEDEFFGEKTFEKAESKLIETCLDNLITKVKLEVNKNDKKSVATLSP